MEEVEKAIDAIILNGYIVTYNDEVSDHREIYSERALDRLVILPLKNYVFEGFDQHVKSNFFSMEGALSNCTKYFEGGESYFSCIECRSDIWCVMCKDCFINSSHACHEYTKSISTIKGGCCDCGDVEAWKRSPRCSIHKAFMESNKHSSTDFINKFQLILKYICRLLESIVAFDPCILDREFVRMLSTYKKNGNSLDPSCEVALQIYSDCSMASKLDDEQKLCTLVFYNNFLSSTDMVAGFAACIPPTDNIECLIKEMCSVGYTCVKYRDSKDNCQKIKDNIDGYYEEIFYEFPIICKVVPLRRYYFMKLSHILTTFIHEFCSKKSDMCDLLGHALYRDTSAASVYIINEPFLWKSVRHGMIYNVLSLLLCSEYGRTYISEFYLGNLDQIFSSFMMDNLDREYCFVNLNNQLLTRPSVAIYLIEDCLTKLLHQLGVKKRKSVMKALLKDHHRQNKLNRMFLLFKSFNITLMACFCSKNTSTKFWHEIFKAGLRVVDFCLCFDDLEPFKTVEGLPKNDLLYMHTRGLIFYIHGSMINISRLLCVSPEAISEILEKLMLEIGKELDTNIGDCITQNSLKQLMVYSNVETKEFSLFNLSRRFFIDILIHTIIDPMSHSLQQLDKIIKDEIMLTWLSLPSVASISSYIIFFTKSHENFPSLIHLYCDYRTPRCFHYLYLQDFTAVQLLMAHMPPDHFLKFLLFNIFPSLREKTDFSQSLSSILSLPEFNNLTAFREIMALIYNAISERHFSGKIDDYKYYLTERHLIHFLVLKNENRKHILENLYFRRDEPNFEDEEIMQNLNGALNRVCITKNPFDAYGSYTLKPEYFDQVNIYYFMYDLKDTNILLKRLPDICKNKKYTFQLPEIFDLKSEFAGINNFIFSLEFFELIMHSLRRQKFNSERSESHPTEDLLITLMCLCFIFKLSMNDEIHLTYKERIDSMFVIFQDINGKNIQELLTSSKDKCICPVLSSVIDYLIRNLNERVDRAHMDKSKSQP